MKFTQIVLATNNAYKVAEIRAILTETGIEILTKSNFSDFPEIPETGDTLEENALSKARTIFTRYGIPAVADDTGLEVDFLHGAPGVMSARYAGEHCSFADNNRKLLSELNGVAPERRRAVFATVIALAWPGGEICLRGEVVGQIAETMRGDNGFGYDPVFLYPPFGRTFAEMTAAEKNSISHRAIAVRKLHDWLQSH